MLCPGILSSLSLYQEVSGNGWLLHAVEGALRRRAGLKIKQRLDQALAFVRVAGSHHEVILLGVIVLGLCRALCVVNGRGTHIDAEVLRVARVDDVFRVSGLLKKKMEKKRGEGEEFKRKLRVVNKKKLVTQFSFGTRTCDLLADPGTNTQMPSRTTNLKHYFTHSSS